MSGEVSFSMRVPRASAFDSRGDLVPELEVVENVLHVRGEPVEVRLEVGPELLAARSGPQVTQRERRGVVEGLTGCVAQRLVLGDDAGSVQRRLHVEDGLLGLFQHGIEPAQHRHREDDVAVLAADVEVAQHVVGDPPDVVRDPPDIPVRRHVLAFPSMDFGVHGAPLGQSIACPLRVSLVARLRRDAPSVGVTAGVGSTPPGSSTRRSRRCSPRGRDLRFRRVNGPPAHFAHWPMLGAPPPPSRAPNGHALALSRRRRLLRLLRGGGRFGAARASRRRRRRRSVPRCPAHRRQHGREARKGSIGGSGVRGPGALPRVRRVSPARRALRRRARSDGRRGRGRAPGGRGALDRRALRAALFPRRAGAPGRGREIGRRRRPHRARSGLGRGGTERVVGEDGCGGAQALSALARPLVRRTCTISPVGSSAPRSEKLVRAPAQWRFRIWISGWPGVWRYARRCPRYVTLSPCLRGRRRRLCPSRVTGSRC